MHCCELQFDGLSRALFSRIQFIQYYYGLRYTRVCTPTQYYSVICRDIVGALYLLHITFTF